MIPEVISFSQKKGIAEGNGRLLSYSQPSPGVDVARFLRHAHGQARVYWQDGQDPVAFAGFGVAAEIFAWGDGRFRDIQHQAENLFHDAVLFDGGQPLSTPRLLGGFSFRDDFSPDYAWSAFHPAHFILPHYQLVQVNGEAWLTINAILPRDESASANLPMLQEAWQTRYDLLRKEEGRRKKEEGRVNRHSSLVTHHSSLVTHHSSLITRHSSLVTHHSSLVTRQSALHYPMPYDAWEAMLNTAIGRIRAGAFKKVVLARVAEARFDQQVDVEGALAYLNETYAGCYRFLFEVRPFHAFFGATPELLVQTNGQRVETMGLAGSIRRGATPEEDAALAAELLHSAKNRHEQQLVVESIQRRLHHAVHSLHIPDPTIYQLSNIQHIHTPIIGILREAAGVLPLVERLHPTPALGGTPRRPALEFLREAEPVPRGWYGAPVGWIDHTLDGKFAVAIRSAVTQENRVWMYAGAGIVADSEPQKEWEETGLKFRPMLEALGMA